MSSKPKLLLVLAGISGSGKTFLTSALARERGFVVIPSLTTRQPRAGEANSIDRRFCALKEFTQLKERQQILCGRFFFGNWYGLDRETIESVRLSSNAVLQLTYKSVHILREQYPAIKAVYITPPTSQTARDAVIARKLGEAETTERIQEIDDETKFIAADRATVKPRFDAYFENARRANTTREFLELIDRLSP